MRPVRYIQVANEEISPTNKAGGWGGSTEERIRFINASYDATKACSPEAIFVLGGIASGNLDGLVVNEGYARYEIRRQNRDGSFVVHTAEELRGPKPAEILRSRGGPVLERARDDVADVHLHGPMQRDPVPIKVIRDKIGGRPMLSSGCRGPSLDYQDSYRPVDHFFAVMERNLMVLSEGLRFCL